MRRDGSLGRVSTSFVCKSCSAVALIPAMDSENKPDIRNGVLSENAVELCYLEGTLNADAGCSSAVTTTAKMCIGKVSRGFTYFS